MAQESLVGSRRRKRVTREERALQIWQVLIGAAHHRQTITYDMLNELIDMGGTIVLSKPLDLIMQYCRDHDLPPLTVLVVGKHTGVPGPGLTTVTDTDADRERVFGYPWYALPPLEKANFAPA
jgi:hypothetical protein